ncbi:hypothetical protein SAMN05428965_0525 [Geodermatophilus sp. DSM 45219]|nr:hypothetical protein SAMN05428965_0525 [Geodermatophilus sp. DSM 45219]
MYSPVRISGWTAVIGGHVQAPPPDSSSLVRLCLAHAQVPVFRRSSRMLLVQQLREPILPEAWHHRGEAERARLAAG